MVAIDTPKDPRKVFASTLHSVGKENPFVLAVSCDSASGAGMGDFVKAFPDRYIEMGISEQNAIGVCAGLSDNGYIPVVAAIAPFISMRCYEQIRNDVGYSNMNVKIVGSSSGLAFSTLSFTHEAVEDMCLLRSIPNMVILNPGDGYEVEMALRSAVAHKGPVYIRMPRHPLEDIADTGKRNFRIGRGEKIKDGGDITIIATGITVNEAKKAADILDAKGIGAGVIDIHTVKPIDRGIIIDAYAKSKVLFTVEEHSKTGGLGSAVAEVIAPVKSTVPLHVIGIEEGIINVGPYREVLESYSLTGEKLAETIYQICK